MILKSSCNTHSPLATSVPLRQVQIGPNYLASLTPSVYQDDYNEQKQEISNICVITQIIIFRGCKKCADIVARKPEEKNVYMCMYVWMVFVA